VDFGNLGLGEVPLGLRGATTIKLVGNLRCQDHLMTVQTSAAKFIIFDS